jgi:hypothetical protein
MPEQLNINKKENIDEVAPKSFDYLRNCNKFLVENEDDLDLNELDTNIFSECLVKIMTEKMGI